MEVVDAGDERGCEKQGTKTVPVGHQRDKDPSVRNTGEGGGQPAYIRQIDDKDTRPFTALNSLFRSTSHFIDPLFRHEKHFLQMKIWSVFIHADSAYIHCYTFAQTCLYIQH